LSEIAVRKIANRPLTEGPYRHHDVEAIWGFIVESLEVFGRQRQVDVISVTTHGATAALLDAKGKLALPVLDYEDGGPETLRAQYEAVRPGFDETGSPPLPQGLNLGAQLYWQNQAFPDAFARTAMILTYPQYWAWRLTCVAASEVTSLGCHTDLWDPHAGNFSSLVDRMGWRKLFPPLLPASATLDSFRPEIAALTGLGPETPVRCGIHDSNASLLPHLLKRQAPFAVVSTGTWVVSMAIGGHKVTLDPSRDTLINVNAFGDPVCSARFMGGREFELLTATTDGKWDDDTVAAVLAQGIMLLPSVQQGSGPFPAAGARWVGEPSESGRYVAAAFYLALMTATCLDLIGAEGPIVVEGPFAANQLYCDMLEAATGRQVLPQAGQATGTSIGAALLAGGTSTVLQLEDAGGVERRPEWRAYADAWRASAGAG
jgi:sugar (pentulose or hexulose) kinase